MFVQLVLVAALVYFAYRFLTPRPAKNVVPELAVKAHVKKALSSEEETAVRDTWSLVAKDLKGNGVEFFLHFFSGYPEYRKYFIGFADVPLDQLAENKRLQAHAYTVMSSINGLIHSLDDPELLFELLVKVGENHKRRQLKVGDFQNLAESLLEFFVKALGEAWVPVAEKGWKKVFSVMICKIEEGLAIED